MHDEEWSQWKHLPETQEFLKEIRSKILECREFPLLDPENTSRTQANVAKRDGMIEAYEEVLNIYKEKMEENIDGENRD